VNDLISRRYVDGVKPAVLKVLTARLTELVGDAVMRSVDLDHVAIAVHNLERATQAFGYLGLDVEMVEEIAHEHVRVRMMHIDAARLEFIEPLTKDSPLQRFLEKYGEGLHHVAFCVEDVDVVFSHLQRRDIQLASDCVKSGAYGHRYFFLHPKSIGGILVELVSEKKA